MTGGAWFTWLDGSVEAVEVFRVRDGRAYVAWPDSERTVEGSRLFPPLPAGPVTVRRPEGWVDAGRLRYLCSADVGGDPVNGCENFTVPGEDYCARHAVEVAS